MKPLQPLCPYRPRHSGSLEDHWRRQVYLQPEAAGLFLQTGALLHNKLAP